jgi:threonylcarbamoyladenosine tRNA methylthiotransferase MtaB
VIVGFPGETEQDYEESARFVKEIGFADLHVFPYSARGGTAAARRTDLFVDDGTKRSRSEAMIAIAKESELSFARQFVGQTLDVLIEQPIGDDSVWEGYTANYLRVRVALPEGPHQNTLVPVQIHSVVSAGKGTYLMGVYHAGE